MVEGSSLLMLVLGIVIGFSTLMLLLSVVVTALAQMTQAICNLRGRNLIFVLAGIIQNAADMPHRQAKLTAKYILNRPESSPIKRRNDANGFLALLFGPVVSWVKPDDLCRSLRAKAGESELNPATLPEEVQQEQVDEIGERWEKYSDHMTKRFAYHMRCVSVFWALVVAFAFQVSTPEIINRLATDPMERAKWEALGEDTLTLGGESLSLIQTNYEKVMDVLIVTFPHHATLLNEVPVSNDGGLLIEKISAALEYEVDRIKVIDAFNDITRGERFQQARDQMNLAERSVATLSVIDITPWPDDSFYLVDGEQPFWSRLNVRNIFGVLLSGLLLTLGAPFWYNTLKNSLALRDRLKPQPKPDVQSSEVKDDNATA